MTANAQMKLESTILEEIKSAVFQSIRFAVFNMQEVLRFIHSFGAHTYVICV
jgi:hypothetical protein